MTERMFPVFDGKKLRRIPWHLVEHLEKSCDRIHDQTLKRLAERGGLSAGELREHIQAANEDRRADLYKMRERDGDEAWLNSWILGQLEEVVGRKG